MLPEPTTAAGQAGLAAVLDAPDTAVIAVDFDGTLAPIVPRPEDARPAPGAIEVLRALAPQVARLAIVTGRAAGEAVRLGGLDAVGGIEVLGHYGLERWRDGRLESPEPTPAVDEAREVLTALVAAAADGVHLEDKHHSLVVHTRPSADPAAALADLLPRVTELAERLGLETVPGRMVVEVRPPGVDKGLAVRRLVEEVDARAVVYCGDDLGDLPAYAAVEVVRSAGGAGLTVASAGDDAPSELADRADLVLRGPEQVVAFLRAVAAELPQRG